MPILGLHHVTATVDDAQDDLDFCVGDLGLRLVKKTVNFDNHHVYHFYYGTIGRERLRQASRRPIGTNACRATLARKTGRRSWPRPIG